MGNQPYPSMAAHCSCFLLGHNSLWVIPVCPCPTTAPGQCSKGSLGGRCLQGGYKQTLRHLLLELGALPSSWQAPQSLPGFSPCQGSSCCRDRAARLVTGRQGHGLLSLHPRATSTDTHQSLHPPSSPIFQLLLAPSRSQGLRSAPHVSP